MLGFKKKSRSAPTSDSNPEQGYADNQIPYEVYETVHEPVARRRRWTVRVVAGLLAVALLVFGGISLRAKLNANNPATQSAQAGSGPGTPSQQVTNGQQKTNAASQQAPQANAPIQKSDANPVNTPQSDTLNTGTVNQPE
jgi:hypothetical protein